MYLYMSNIYSRISLQAIEFYSQICEQTRNIRQLTLTQVQKNTPLLGYFLTGDRSIFVKQEGRSKRNENVQMCEKMITFICTTNPRML